MGYGRDLRRFLEAENKPAANLDHFVIAMFLLGSSHCYCRQDILRKLF
jgi:hypothetical protein